MRKLILASLTISSALGAQSPSAPPRTRPLRGSLAQRLTSLLDQPPFDRASWGIFVQDDGGRILYQRNADRFAGPASNTKLVVPAPAAVLLPADYRARTSVYANGRVQEPRAHRVRGFELFQRRQLIPVARHDGHLGRGNGVAAADAVDRELRAA